MASVTNTTTVVRRVIPLFLAGLHPFTAAGAPPPAALAVAFAPARAHGCRSLTPRARRAHARARGAWPQALTSGVRADAGDDQPIAVDPFDDRDDVQRQDANPGEHEEQAQHTADAERREADDARDHDVNEQCDELGDHEHDAVLGVPLDLTVGFLE